MEGNTIPLYDRVKNQIYEDFQRLKRQQTILMTVRSKRKKVLALKEFRRNEVHIEITNLVIPKIGDWMDRIKEMAKWIKDTLGRETPFHLLRFHPDYKMTTTPATTVEDLEKAYMNARNVGLHYVYIGNVPGHPSENTYCPNCNELLVKRYSFEITRWNMTKDMRCPVCAHHIPIKGELHSRGAPFPYPLF